MLGRDVSRGAFYTTLERLEAKGLLTWRLRPRGGSNDLPERCLQVTSDGMKELRELRKALITMWGGLEPLFDKGSK